MDMNIIPLAITNLIQDPSFEAYTPNPYWSESSVILTTPLCTIADCGNGGGTAGPRTGSVWAWFGGTEVDEQATLTQTVFFPSCATATLQFYYWIGAAQPGGYGSFMAGVDGNTPFISGMSQIGSYPTYTLVSIDVSSFANGAAHTIMFHAYTYGGIVNFNLDDVSLSFSACSIPNVTSSVRANADITGATDVNFTVTFSQPVTGVDTGDFSLTSTGVSGPAVTGVSGSGSVYTVTVNTGSGSGTIKLNVMDNDTILNGDAPLGGVGTGNGDFTGGETYTITKTWIFGDVPASYWANSFIERLYNASVTGGCTTSPLNYCPESIVTRAQMAVFLLRGMHGSSYTPPAVGASTGFADVPVGYWAAAWIKQLAAEGITSGCGAGVYCPDATVTRAQMAIFLLRAKHGLVYTPPAATGVFTDVPVGYWADKWIEQLAAEAITSGCGAGVYCPDASVTRAQMAVFLVKTFNLP